MTAWRRLRGLRALVGDAVEHGSTAIERVQKDLARRPFAILESIPPVAGAARVAHATHDAFVSGQHRAVRLVNRAVGAALDVAIDAVVKADGERDAGQGSATARSGQ